MKLIDSLPLSTLVFASLTLGLAPFVPEPHVWEKLKLLFSGMLVQPIDVFDLALHGLPWLLLGLKIWRKFGSVKGTSKG
ncbi:RND transporter [Celeribacter sp. PS-C1]|uniref:RND transporter n=1 Tax=Celeribacter sp. PS-C1 TaxID=2820813 RepID=UPI001CA4B002|nr:RND transporter [Celeribacter sp. PS-C1]MBW6417298.1 RND transporter [Celeribacter sp. PS-C1]